jgi:hypothetical protein
MGKDSARDSPKRAAPTGFFSGLLGSVGGGLFGSLSSPSSDVKKPSSSSSAGGAVRAGSARRGAPGPVYGRGSPALGSPAGPAVMSPSTPGSSTSAVSSPGSAGGMSPGMRAVRIALACMARLLCGETCCVECELRGVAQSHAVLATIITTRLRQTPSELPLPPPLTVTTTHHHHHSPSPLLPTPPSPLLPTPPLPLPPGLVLRGESCA